MPLTKQEAFDKALAHLRQQGKRAVTPTGACCYRGLNDTKCAIGALIPDAMYDRGMEMKGARRLLDCRPQLQDVMSLADREFYSDMQSLMHDGISDYRSFHESLEYGAQQVAECYKLEYAAPQRGTV